MRQVPRLLIIGDGRVARHFGHYLSLLHIPFETWNRKQPLADVRLPASAASHIFLAIRDDAIEGFIQDHLKETPATKIHFSGALVTPHAFGAHPLMTFGESFYSLEKYRQIPFVVDMGAPAFDALLPGLENPHVRLAPEHKAKYHALCVLSGNFSCLLWQKLLSTLELEFKIPPDLAHAYLRQQADNLIEDYKAAFTGPLARDDRDTVAKNINALKDDPFAKIYACFVENYPALKETLK